MKQPHREHVRLARYLTFGFFLFLVIPCAVSLAQVVTPITSSGLNTTVSAPITLPSGQTQFNITGGTRPGGGANLFHSFGNFDVPNNNIANFLNNSGLATGGAMSKKSSEKKNNSIDRDIKTLIQPEGHRCGITIYKGQTENYKKILPETYKHEPGFSYSSQASWKTEIQTPVYNRKTEQQFTDTQDILCSIPAFRQEVIQLRDQLASRSIYLGQIAAQVCSAWKIPNGKPWVEWLLTHWDPVTTTYPPHFSPTPPNSFLPWTIELNYLRETKGWPEACRTATITLNAGVSAREAIRIATLAQKALDRSKVKRGRPSPSNQVIDTLRSEFVKLGIPKPRKRAAMALKVQKTCIQSGKGKFSETFIGNELRRWLREQKQTVRRYVTEPST